MNILHVGIKYWPYFAAYSQDSLQGIRGGGMVKYNHSLLPNLSNEISTLLITQLLEGQKKVEEDGNIKIFRLKTFGGRGTRQIISNIGSIFYALKIAFSHKIDVIHGHMPIGIFFAYLLSVILKKPVIGTPYSFPANNLRFPFANISKFLETKIYKRLDRIIFETEGNRKILSEYRNVEYKNSVVINTGIDVPVFQKQYLPKEKINLFFIGRIVKIKGLENLIISLSLLTPDELNQIHLDIVGEGNEFDSICNLIKENNLNEFVTMHGFVNDSTVFFQNADIFILPSHSEGLSIALLEAMSYGLVCVVNDFGLPFGSETVYVIENNRPESISQALSYFINNRDKLNIFGKNARREIIEGFSISVFAKKYEELLNNLKIK